MKPNVWMITSSFYPYIGGSEQQVLNLSQRLMENGWIIRVLTRQNNPQYENVPPKKEIHEGIHIYRIPCNGKGKLGSIQFIINSLVFLNQNGRGNIFHAHGIGAPSAIAILAAKIFNGKSIIKLRSGVNYYQELYKYRFGRFKLEKQLKAADVIIVVNKSLIEALSKWGIHQKRINYIPNSIDTHKYRPATEHEKKIAREKILPRGLIERKYLVLYIGRLAHLKGVDILLSAWAHLTPNIKEQSNLAIVGDGPEKDRLISYSRQLGIDHSVHFFGLKTEILPFYSASDFLVLPSRTEGLSNTMIEAMACGLPAICTKVGGSLDWIQNKRNGLLVSPENVDDLTDILYWMFSNPDKWKSIGLQGRYTVVRYLSIEQRVIELEQIYSTL